MKKIFFTLLALTQVSAFAQTKPGCCAPSSSEKFTMLASTEKFASAHADPLPIHFVPDKGSMIDYPTGGGNKANAFLVKADKPTDNWIILVHEWWGLNDYIKQEAEKWQKETGNANVLAVDLYDGKVASTSEEAQKQMTEMKESRVIEILKGAIAYAGPKAKIYTIGWCMGGGWSLQTTLLAGRQAAGCVMYYGMPETDKSKLSTLNADVLGIFASKDQWINTRVVQQFQRDMKDLKKHLLIKMYDADHAFANPSNPHYDKIAGDDAHKLALNFFIERMK